MTRPRYAALLDFLHRELGDGLLVAISYKEDDHTVLHETPTARQFLKDTATIDPDAMQEDLVIGSMQAQVDGNRYGVGTDAKLFCSDLGTTCQLLESQTRGVMFVVDEATTFQMPTFVEECLTRLG